MLGKKISHSNMLSCFRTCPNKKDFESNYQPKTNEEAFFLKNGAAVLERLIVSFNGKCNPIRIYSIGDLNKATNDFDWDRMLHSDLFYIMYKGVHEGREISVKKFDATSRPNEDCLEMIANEVAIASQTSKHKNFLKLLGWCLETELPILVYEFPGKGNLSRHIYWKNEQLAWDVRLRIAMEIANALAYLHYGLSNVIIHRRTVPRYIFLDRNYAAKLSEFRLSIPIPLGQTHVDAKILGGSLEYVAPEAATRRITEKSDVYSFGIVLFEILTGKRRSDFPSISKSRNSANSEGDVLDHEDVANFCDTQLNLKDNILEQGNKIQVMECGNLLERCLKINPDGRPDMIEVAKALRLIKSIK